MTKILVAGDYCPRSRVADLIKSKQYDEVFGDIKSLTKISDYSIVNFECPVVLDSAKPIEKCGPNLKCNINAVAALQFAGFNMVTLANNHFYDYGEQGIKDTLKTCKEYGIDFVGGGKNIIEAQKIFYKKIQDKTFAIVNCCEHEFSIATNNTGGSNPLNPIANYYQIQEAKKNADYVIVIVHGGHEHYQLPSPRMKETYRFFIDAGADAVINHHQHCYSGHEIYKEKPIFYGLGNFCFDNKGKNNSIWNEGYMISLCFENPKIGFELIPYIQGNEKSGVVLATEDKKHTILKNVAYLNTIIKNDMLLKKHFEDFAKYRRKRTYLLFEPYNNRYLKALRVRGILPSLINKKKLLQIINYINCESHRDVLIENFNN